MTMKLVRKHSRVLPKGCEPMGEIRVDVTLSNSVDEALARRGDLPPGEVRRCQVDALVDTGAVRLCVPADLAKQLGIATTGRSFVEYGDGRVEEVELTEPIGIEIEGRKTAEPALVLGNEVLIGQITLESTDLWADCQGQRLVPNPEHPDQPIFKVK